jgi:hypothetical protein
MGVRVEGVILSPAVLAKEATRALSGPTLPFVFLAEHKVSSLTYPEERRSNDVDSTNQHD